MLFWTYDPDESYGFFFVTKRPGTMVSKVATFPDLNDRQRAYLLAAFDRDQEQESAQKSRSRQTFTHTPASVWRWMHFGAERDAILGTFIRDSPLRALCQPQVDEGSGSTWAALEARGLAQTEQRIFRPLRSKWTHKELYVMLTAKGRKLARELTGTKAKPRGVFSASTWRALGLAYQAGDEGLTKKFPSYGGVRWETWLILRNRDSDLVEEFLPDPNGPLENRSSRQYRLRLTPAGRSEYIRRWAAHKTAYPDADMPDPSRPPENAKKSAP